MNANASAANSLWGGPCLYTPMHVDALMVGAPNQQQNWAQVATDYPALTQGLDPAPLPFTGRLNGPPATGVHLHWTLPHGLRRGKQQDTAAGDVDFPWAPNRWLVTRFFTGTPGSEPTVTAWVLASDFTSENQISESTYPDATNPFNFLYIGQQFPLAQWAEPSTLPAPFLQAPGPSDLSWSAVYDNVQNVFGFHDPLTDVSGSGSCTYAVLGWYATPANDPLFGAGQGFTTQAEWQSLMDGLRWALGSPADLEARTNDAKAAFRQWIAAYPQTGAPPATPEQLEVASQTLCQGMVFGLPWTGPQTNYPQPAILTSGAAPVVAVGSNAAESVAAYMGSVLSSQGQKPADVENLLLAFQTDLIFDYIQDPAAFAAACHENRFERAPGGTQWTVVLPVNQGGDAAAGSQEIPLNEAQTQALTVLQSLQTQLDNTTRSLDSQRWELLSAWWKLQMIENTPPVNTLLQTQVQNYINLLTSQTLPNLQNTINALQTQCSAAQTTLTGLLGTEYELKASDAGAFTRPTDPVVLIAAASSDTKLDPPTDIGDSLFTRFTGQTVAGLTVDFTGISTGTPSVNILAADLQPAVQGLTTAGLPKETVNLWIENLLLDPGNSAWLAKLAFAKAGVTPTAQQLQQLSTRIAAQQTLVWNPAAKVLDQRTVASAAGLMPMFSGQDVHVPSMIAVAPWSPPWTPLYLDWAIEWFPSAATPQQMFSQWTLGEFDFTYNGQAVGPTSIALQMRSLLTSNYPTGLVGKIQKFLDADPDLAIFQIEDLKATVNQLGSLDVMVQSLTGFNEWMLSRVPQATQLVSDPNVAKWTDGVLTWISDTPTGPAPVYNPLRAGHFRITNLRVIDAYGQVLPGTIQNGAVLPIRSQALLPNFGQDQSLMQIVPRVAQPVRLDLQLLDRDNDGQLSNSSELTSPICGWLLPNHLDESLVVFDDKGVAYGEIIKVVTDSGTSLRWDANPGTDGVLGGPPQIANRHLLQIVTNLLRLGLTTTDPLDQLLDLIDVTLWSLDPLGQLETGNLTLLLGRPIAVVRASASFELQGDPDYVQDWAATGKMLDQGFPQVKLPLRIGDFKYSNNGSFGYFLNDDYGTCFSMYNYVPSLGQVRRVVRSSPQLSLGSLRELVVSARAKAADIAAASAASYVQPGPTLQLACGGGDQVLLTALVDPRGALTSATGTVPFDVVSLPNGPVDAAMHAMEVSFRMGPLLLNAEDVKVPLPTGTNGKWSWIERSGVTFWNEEGPLKPADETARLPDKPPSLREGWLMLGSALGTKENATNG